MNRIACLSKKLKEFFNATADKISDEVGFIKRKRKLKTPTMDYLTKQVVEILGFFDCIEYEIRVEKICTKNLGNVILTIFL